MNDFPIEELEVATEFITTNTYNSCVILFNDRVHTFDEVISQIIKAIKCDWEKANNIAMQAHNEGKAVVYEGKLLVCLKVSGILEEIDLHTQIET